MWVRGQNSLTSHAIVGEPLAELVHHDEEDADGVAKHLFGLSKQQQRKMYLVSVFLLVWYLVLVCIMSLV